jgi:hypothetical protein
VASNDPLAQFQQLKAPAEVANLQDLAIVRSLVRANPNVSAAQINDAVNSILASSGVSHIPIITLPDITVEQGATVVFGGPITSVVANNFYVDGTIIAHGSLNISCASFGASPPAPPLRPPGGPVPIPKAPGPL